MQHGLDFAQKNNCQTTIAFAYMFQCIIIDRLQLTCKQGTDSGWSRNESQTKNFPKSTLWWEAVEVQSQVVAFTDMAVTAKGLILESFWFGIHS
jgi:hypothetical protein